MLTVESVKEKAKELSPAPITRENYKTIALMIHPFSWVDPASISDDFVENHLDRIELPEFTEQLRGQRCNTPGDWTDMVVGVVLRWQYNAAMLRAFPELKPLELKSKR